MEFVIPGASPVLLSAWWKQFRRHKVGDVVLSFGSRTGLSWSEEALVKACLRHARTHRFSLRLEADAMVLAQIARTADAEIPLGERRHRLWLERWGDMAADIWREVMGLSHLAAESLWLVVRRGQSLPGETLRQLLKLGVGAVPITVMLCFLVGLTLAVQSATQLANFGASIYLASGIGISMVTEIGPLMAAVILAGRSGSAIAAEVSTMVVQEEVRALRVMGVNPIAFLLRPRVLALMIAQPLLTILAQLSGIFAGFLVGILLSGLPGPLFLSELRGAVEPWYLGQSMIKAVTFGFLIALIAVRSGLQADGGAGAVGQQTTKCVVRSITAIILADAVFSFLFYS